MSTSLPPIDQSLLPASVRTGSPAAKKAYEAALGFEQLLVAQVAKELGKAAGGGLGSAGATAGADAPADSSGADDGATGLGGSDPAAGVYGDLLPQALTSAIMSSGGLGVAGQLASAIDPTAFRRHA